MMTTVRMVQSTIAAMPTAREMKEKFRASREAISADTMSPRAKAVRTCGGRVEEGRLELCCLASTPQPPLSAPPKAQDSQGVRKTSELPFPDATSSPIPTCTALKMAIMPVGQKQQMVVSTAMGI